VIGAYTGGKLRHFGYAGSGFSEKGLREAIERMKPFFTKKSPFVDPPNIKEKIQWVQPKLVCEIEYAELTDNEQLRQTTFLGWRDVVFAIHPTLRLFDHVVRLKAAIYELKTIELFAKIQRS
jgi:ATP-dependent DNA ligase